MCVGVWEKGRGVCVGGGGRGGGEGEGRKKRGGGGGGADVVHYACVRPCAQAGLTGWKTRRFPPKAGSRRPWCKNHPTPRRGKRLRGSPTSPPTPLEEGERNFVHLLGVGCPGSGMK